MNLTLLSPGSQQSCVASPPSHGMAKSGTRAQDVERKPITDVTMAIICMEISTSPAITMATGVGESLGANANTTIIAMESTELSFGSVNLWRMNTIVQLANTEQLYKCLTHEATKFTISQYQFQLIN